MTTRQEVIDAIISLNVVEKLANRYFSALGNNKEDFIQHLYLIILEMPEERLIRLYDKGELVFYLMRIGRNQALYPKSDFNKNFNDPHIIYKEDLTNEQEDN